MSGTSPSLRARCLAEGVGTFCLLAFGTGAIVTDAVSGGALGHGGVAAAFGGVVMIVIYAVGDVSGAHLNPAVSFAFWRSGAVDTRTCRAFIAAQCVGAVAGSLAVRALAPEHPDWGMTSPSVSLPAALAIECFLTFVLVSVILHVVAQGGGPHAGLAIGGTVALLALVGGPWTGASLHPARSLGPALVAGVGTHLWLYWAAPLLGGALAVVGCRSVRGGECCRPAAGR